MADKKSLEETYNQVIEEEVDEAQANSKKHRLIRSMAQVRDLSTTSLVEKHRQRVS